jgi:hypothetical protein
MLQLLRMLGQIFSLVQRQGEQRIIRPIDEVFRRCCDSELLELQTIA